jgi:uncharacterized damage-inducible protein DinB
VASEAARRLAERRVRLLAWMRKQRFSELIAERGLRHGSLLRTVEHVVLQNHRLLHEEFMGESWSAPSAYRWMRYENPDPVSQLIEATNSLERLWKGALAADPEKAAGVLARAAEHEGPHLDEAVSAGRALGYRGK